MSGFDSRLKYVVSNWFFGQFGQSTNNVIRIILQENNVINSEEFLSYNRDCISLNKPKVKVILDVIHYYKFMYRN